MEVDNAGYPNVAGAKWGPGEASVQPRSHGHCLFFFRNQLPEEATEGVAMRWIVEYPLWFAMERSVTPYNRMSEYVIVRHCPEAKITMMAPGSACSDTR